MLQGLLGSLWLAAGIHVVEEAWGNWPAWARRYVPGVTWRQFGIVNAAFLLLCILAGRWGETHPVLALSVAGLMLVNALMHLGLSVSSQTYSPGLITALGVYLPLGGGIYALALKTQLVSWQTAGLAFGVGMMWMALPLLGQYVRLRMERNVDESR